MVTVMTTETLKKPVNISQSNELTEAAYYLPLQAKRVLWLCLMQCYPMKDDPDSVSPIFTVTVADYQKYFKVSVDTASTDVKKGHGLVMFSAAFALLTLRLRGLGLFVLLASLPVAWSRIFLGVHFPLDMAGAAAVAAVAVWVSKGVWQAFGPAMVRICEAISQRMFSWLPARFTP